MEIKFSKNDYKDIDNAINKIKAFQLETFLKVIGQKAKIPSGIGYSYLENLYESARYQDSGELYKLVTKYPRNEYDHMGNVRFNEDWYLVPLISGVITIPLGIEYLFRCIGDENSDFKFRVPLMYEQIWLLVILLLFLIFFIAVRVNKYKNNRKKVFYEKGRKIVNDNQEVFEMLDELEDVKHNLEEISKNVKISNSLELRYKYGAKATFDIDRTNYVRIECEDVNVMLNDATSYRRSDVQTNIHLSDEQIEKMFHDKIVDFTWLDGEANSELVDVAEICKKYNLNLDTVEKLEEHETYDGKDDNVCVVYDE